MQFKKLVVISAMALTLQGCANMLQGIFQEDPEIAKKCTPVQSVLAKNYKIASGFNAILIGLGGNYERTGVQLNADQTYRIMEADRLCRAWVNKAIKETDWSDYLLESSSASIAAIKYQANRSSSENPEISKQAATDVRNSINELREILSNSLNFSKEETNIMLKAVEEKSSRYAKYSPNEVNDILVKKFRNIEDDNKIKWDEFQTYQDTFREQFLETSGHFNGIDAQLARIEARLQPNKPTSEPSKKTSCVYFSTGKSEINWDSSKSLAKLAYQLKSQNVVVDIEAYTDARGKKNDNVSLSFARGNAVAQYLKETGVTVRQVKGYGVKVSNNSSDWAKNRVAIVIPVNASISGDSLDTCQ